MCQKSPVIWLLALLYVNSLWASVTGSFGLGRTFRKYEIWSYTGKSANFSFLITSFANFPLSTTLQMVFFHLALISLPWINHIHDVSTRRFSLDFLFWFFDANPAHFLVKYCLNGCVTKRKLWVYTISEVNQIMKKEEKFWNQRFVIG